MLQIECIDARWGAKSPLLLSYFVETSLLKLPEVRQAELLTLLDEGRKSEKMTCLFGDKPSISTFLSCFRVTDLYLARIQQWCNVIKHRITLHTKIDSLKYPPESTTQFHEQVEGDTLFFL
jgi:hypothetical protein